MALTIQISGSNQASQNAQILLCFLIPNAVIFLFYRTSWKKYRKWEKVSDERKMKNKSSNSNLNKKQNKKPTNQNPQTKKRTKPTVLQFE